MGWVIYVESRLPRTPQEEQKEKDGKPSVTVINEGGRATRRSADRSQLSRDDDSTEAVLSV